MSLKKFEISTKFLVSSFRFSDFRRQNLASSRRQVLSTKVDPSAVRDNFKILSEPFSIIVFVLQTRKFEWVLSSNSDIISYVLIQIYQIVNSFN